MRARRRRGGEGGHPVLGGGKGGREEGGEAGEGRERAREGAREGGREAAHLVLGGEDVEEDRGARRVVGLVCFATEAQHDLEISGVAGWAHGVAGRAHGFASQLLQHTAGEMPQGLTEPSLGVCHG